MRDDSSRPDRPRQLGIDLVHHLSDPLDRGQRVEAAENDAVRRCPEQASDDPAFLLGDDEGRIEAVELRYDAEAAEQAEEEVVLRFMSLEKRSRTQQKRVGVSAACDVYLRQRVSSTSSRSYAGSVRNST